MASPPYFSVGTKVLVAIVMLAALEYWPLPLLTREGILAPSTDTPDVSSICDLANSHCSEGINDQQGATDVPLANSRKIEDESMERSKESDSRDDVDEEKEVEDEDGVVLDMPDWRLQRQLDSWAYRKAHKRSDVSPLPDSRSPFSTEWNNSVAICAIMKEENTTDVREWLMYHRYDQFT
jgi:hypothetical protein